MLPRRRLRTIVQKSPVIQEDRIPLKTESYDELKGADTRPLFYEVTGNEGKV